MSTVLKTRRKALKDIYVARVTENSINAYTTETPQKLGRAINAKVSVKKNIDKTRSDDTIEEVIESFDSIEIDIEVNKLSMEQKALLRGSKFENGYLIGNANDLASEVAIGWRSKNTNGKYEFIWYYAGKFNQGYDESYETEEDKVKTQTPKLKGTFYAREKDGNYHVEVDENYLLDKDTDAKTAITNWFSKVQEPVQK